jgi:anthrone oxygenase-like protein
MVTTDAALLLRLVTAAVTGTLAGAMLLIKLVLVPFWRSVPPREFRVWFSANSGRIRGLMVPLGAAGVGTSLLTAAAETRGGGAVAPATVAAAASGGIVLITVTVNEPANAKFEQVDFDDQETSQLLRKWSRWHDARVILGVVAVTAAAITVASSPRPKPPGPASRARARLHA